MPGHRSIPLDYPHWTVLFSCTRFGGMPGYSSIDCIGLHALGVSIMFYTFWRPARLQIDSTGLLTLNASSVFYMHCSSTIKTLFLPLPAFQFDGPAHLSRDRPSRPQSAYTPRTQGLKTSIEAPRGGQRERLRETVRLPTLSVSLVLMLWRLARLQIYSIGLPAFLLCFTRFGSMPGYTLIPLDCPHCMFSIGFGATPGYSLRSIGLPSLSASIVLYMQCSSNIKALFLAIPALQFEGLRLTFPATSQAGPVRIHSAH